MKYKAYNSDPVPFSLSREHYQSSTNDVVFVVERTRSPLTAKQIINFITNPQTKIEGETYIPTRTIAVPVDKEAALKNGIVAACDSSRMVDTVYLKLSDGKQNLLKSEMMMIDLFANYKWDRPIYFTLSFGDIELGQKDYYQFDGFVYKFVPILTPGTTTGIDEGMVNTDILYDNLMNKYRWGNMNQPNVLIDYHNMVAIAMSQNVRGQFSRLAKALLSEGKTEKAIEALDRCMELTPRNPFFYNISLPQHELAIMEIIDCYYRANETEKARKLFDDFTEETSKCLRFFINMGNNSLREVELNIRYLHQMIRTALTYGDEERAQKLNNLITGYKKLYKEGV
jgi:tetratricopeptide (TPR) repeat protein